MIPTRQCPKCGAPVQSVTGRYCLTLGCDWKVPRGR